MSKRSQIYILIASGLVFAQSVASLVLRPTFALTVLSDLTQSILLLSGVLSLLPNIAVTRGRTRLFWALMTLGVTFWLAYQLLWTYFEVILRRDVPSPFVGDVVLFLHIVPMMAALALQPHVEQDDRTARLGSLDFALLLIWWLYLYLFAVIPWQYAHTNETTYEHALNVLYLTEKMVFLAGLALVWTRSKGAWRTVYAHWFGASLVYALSSYVANWGIERHTYYTGSFYDVPLVASMAWVISVGLLALDLSPKQMPAPLSPGHGVWVARLGMVAIFSLPLFAAWSVFDPSTPPDVSTFRLVVTLATMLVMGAMVFIKQHLLDRELLRLLRTSKSHLRTFDESRHNFCNRRSWPPSDNWWVERLTNLIIRSPPCWVMPTCWWRHRCKMNSACWQRKLPSKYAAPRDWFPASSASRNRSQRKKSC